MASEWYVKVSGAFKEVNEAFIKVSGSWKEIQEGYIKVSGAWKKFYVAFVATAFTTQTSTTTVTVPDGANAIHVQAAVGGGSGGVIGAEYDKAGGESAGAGGASGGYISDQVYSVTQGETLTLTVGSSGSASGGSPYNSTAGNGGTTSLTGSTTGSIFSLTGGVGGSGTGGGVQGPLRSNSPSVAGTATVSASVLTSGDFKESDGASATIPSASTLDDGPVGSYNNSGNGAAGTNPQNCSGDNCQITGGVGGASYNGNILGGAGGVASSTAGGNGTRGSGAGGGGAQGQTNGGTGGAGEIVYRFLRVQ
tara:strand:+ start:1101 stop:2024 length:924 start_codon:yes stop_codon:yes gene_type:complete